MSNIAQSGHTVGKLASYPGFETRRRQKFFHQKKKTEPMIKALKDKAKRPENVLLACLRINFKKLRDEELEVT